MGRSALFTLAALLPALLSLLPAASASEVFVEAESFISAGGWGAVTGTAARSASGLALLGGAGGAKDGVATAQVSIKDAGHYRLWVRYASGPSQRGTSQSPRRGDGWPPPRPYIRRA